MSWREHHEQSDGHAWNADIARARGDLAEAKRCFALAAAEEEAALESIDPTKSRTYGITAVSTVALYREAGWHSDAQRVAHTHLGAGKLPHFAQIQLRELIESLWYEADAESAGIRLGRDRLEFSIKGTNIPRGTAPLALVKSVEHRAESFVQRVVEFHLGEPHRKRGAPSRMVREGHEIWIAHAIPGSYRFALTVRQPLQANMFAHADASSDAILERSMAILAAGVESPDEGLPELVSDDAYQASFLKLARELSPGQPSTRGHAPLSSRFSHLEVRSRVSNHDVTLTKETRFSITEAIRRRTRAALLDSEREEELRGVLRAIHLESDWIRIAVGGELKEVRGVGEEVDDYIGQMLNREVVAAVSYGRGALPRLLDIELVS